MAITDAELVEMESLCHCGECGNDTHGAMARLIAEVRRLRGLLEKVAVGGDHPHWDDATQQDIPDCAMCGETKGLPHAAGCPVGEALDQ